MTRTPLPSLFPTCLFGRVGGASAVAGAVTCAAARRAIPAALARFRLSQSLRRRGFRWFSHDGAAVVDERPGAAQHSQLSIARAVGWHSLCDAVAGACPVK